MTSRKRSAEDSEAQSKKAKTGKGLVPPQIDDNGDKFWEVSKNRRVTISNFRGKNMVNIREYYEKDGKTLPGKKGISLPMDQFSAFIQLLPEIEDILVEAGEHPPRADYERPANDNDNGKAGTASPSKQNIEETSDEDE